MTAGRPSPSKLGIELLTRRATRLSRPRCRNRLTRNRVSRSPSKTMWAKSTPPSSSRIFCCRGVRSGNISRSMSAVVSGGSCICRRTPPSRMRGRQADLEVEVGPLVLHHHPEQLVGFGLARRRSRRRGFDAVDMGWHSCGKDRSRGQGRSGRVDGDGSDGLGRGRRGRSAAAAGRPRPAGRGRRAGRGNPWSRRSCTRGSGRCSRPGRRWRPPRSGRPGGARGCPAPPEATTGTSTASATARVIGRS